MKTVAEEEVDGGVNMTTDKHVEFQVRLCDAETKATTRSLADIDRIMSLLEREMYGITSNEQMRFKQELSIRLIKFETWWQAISVQELRKIIKQRVIQFGYPMLHPMSHISESIRRMGSGDNVTTDISERLHIGNVTQAYQSTNNVNYIRQMLKHHNRCTTLDYMDETPSCLALQGWYDIDLEEAFNLLSAANKRQNPRRANLLRFQHCQEESCFYAVSPKVHRLRETHVRWVCRSIKLTSPSDASEDFGIPNFGQQFHSQIEEDWGHEVSGLVHW